MSPPAGSVRPRPALQALCGGCFRGLEASYPPPSLFCHENAVLMHVSARGLLRGCCLSGDGASGVDTPPVRSDFKKTLHFGPERGNREPDAPENGACLPASSLAETSSIVTVVLPPGG